jgi:site-specific DNA recombinase
VAHRAGGEAEAEAVNLGGIPEPRKRRKKGAAAPGAAGLAAVYVRVSVDEQDAPNGGSLASQEEACREVCARRKLEVIRVYTDNGVSGGTLERPALNELRADVAAGKVSAVVVYALDRLSRRQADTLALLEEFKDAGAGLASATQEFDTTTDMGRALVGFLAIFAELQRSEIRSRTKRALDAKKQRGEAFNRPPFGTKIEADRDGRPRYVANPATWPIVARILAERDAGSSCQKIADRLNAEGVPTPTGYALKEGKRLRASAVRSAGKWSAATVAGLCSSEAVRAVAS